MILGLYWKKSTGAGAIASMVLGIIAWFYFRNGEEIIPALVPATLISFVTMVVVSLITYQTGKEGKSKIVNPKS
jgi:Na+/proline symporter